MDTKKNASIWENVESELKAALFAFVEESGRVIGNGLNEGDIEKAVESSPLVCRMRELFEYGIHARWNPSWESIMVDDEDAIFFVQDLRDFRVVSENCDDTANVRMPLSRYVAECALARAVYDNETTRLVFEPNGDFYKGFSAGDLALLSGLDERTIRNQMGSKGPLRSVSVGNRAFVRYDEGAAWLKSRGFKETQFIGEEARDLARLPFRNLEDLIRYLGVLMTKANISEADPQTELQQMLESARAETIQFNLEQAAAVARLLNLQPQQFSKALVQLVADEQSRAIEHAFNSVKSQA